MKRKYILPGVLLILCGIYFLINSLPGVALPNGLFLVAVGAALLISRLCSRNRYGLTIAGFILFWLGMARLMLDVLHIGAQYGLVAVPLAVALAFFLTHIFEFRRLGNWPMVPALVLTGFAGIFFLMLTPSVNAIFKPYYGTILPLLLILCGICVLVRGSRRSKAAAAQPPVTQAQPVIPVQPEPPQPAAPAEQDVPAEPAYAEPIDHTEPAAADMEADLESAAPVIEVEEPKFKPIPEETAAPAKEPEELTEEEKKPETTAE